MRFSEGWLGEWVDHGCDRETLVHRLTMAGLEVEAVQYLGGGLDGVFVGRIEDCQAHPNADRLTLCTVDVGEGEPRSIVCGASNMGPGDRVPVAVPGTLLPNGLTVERTRLRGQVSEGMLCSATELHLGEDSEGLMILGGDAPVGSPLRDYLDLDDAVVELDLTPNRGDCLSIAGVAREVSALADRPLQAVGPEPVPPDGEARREVRLEAGADCPRYLGRVVTGIDATAETPAWLAERLRRCGIRPVSPVVDVTNYVMLELGQPLHAFDDERLTGEVTVRHARSGESLTLLDGREAELGEGTLVIADDAGAQAVAGVMGGEATGVGPETANLFLESAHFRPGAMAGRARQLGLASEAAHRFERGVDPELPRRALERATALLREVVGGAPGPVIEAENASELPDRPAIAFRPAYADARLGTGLGAEVMADYFRRLGLAVEGDGEQWAVTPPSFRFDLGREADLVEEVARLHGYDRLPAAPPAGSLKTRALPEARVGDRGLRQLLIDRGFREVITYSFVDPDRVARLDPDARPLALANPLSREQSVMRPDLFSGLLEMAAANQARQNERLRLFELGRVFPRSENGAIAEREALGGLLAGPVDPPHWAGEARDVDFFDAKGLAEALLARTGAEAARFEAGEHPALHPGQTARLRLGEEPAGWVGTLHPGLMEPLELAGSVAVLQLDLSVLRRHIAGIPAYQAVSRLPVTRRDLAIVVPEGVTAAAVSEVVAAYREAGEGTLDVMDWRIFDVYTGRGVESGQKSLGLALVLQARDQTPTDEQIEAVVSGVVERLASALGARLRS